MKSNILAALCALLMLSCNSETDYLVAVIKPSKTTAITRDRIRVKIDFEQDNSMKTKLTIANHGRETIVIGPADIVLRIERAGVVLPAIGDFTSYIAMRYDEAKKECAGSKNPVSCGKAIEAFFRPFFEAKPFQFGIIMPGDEKDGYIAFNLPDPINRTPEAQRLVDSLKSMMNLLDGRIEINTSALSKNQEFVFPVNITALSDARQAQLRIMQYF